MRCNPCSPCETQRVPNGAGGQGQPGGTLPDGDTGDYLRWTGTLWVPSSWTMPLAVTDNDLGEVLTVTAPNVAEMQPLFQRTILLAFGARAISDTLVFLFTWLFDSNASNTIAAASFLYAPMSGRLRDMRVIHSTPLASADDITYFLVVNDVDTALSVTLNTGSAGPVSDVVNIVNVGATDRISVRAEGATALRNIRPSVSFTLEF